MYFAYIDPGTGGQMLGQASGMFGIIAGFVLTAFAGIAVFFRSAVKAFLNKIAHLFRRRMSC